MTSFIVVEYSHFLLKANIILLHNSYLFILVTCYFADYMLQDEKTHWV